MKLLLVFASGFIAPFVIWMAAASWFTLQDWRDNCRYKRAWKKFTDEWNAKSSVEQNEFLSNHPHYSNMQYAESQGAWFVYRWNGGHTTEV